MTDECHSLDEGSLQRWYHFQLNPHGPSWPLCRHHLTHTRCFFHVVPTMEHGIRPTGRRGGAGTPVWEIACCSVLLWRLSGGSGKASLLIAPAPWAEPSATLKILPRSVSPPGCERQLPRHREKHRENRDAPEAVKERVQMPPFLGRPRLNVHSHFIIPPNIPCPFKNGNADMQ